MRGQGHVEFWPEPQIVGHFLFSGSRRAGRNGRLLWRKGRAAQHPLHWVEQLHPIRSEEHTSELQSRGHLVCRLLLEKKKKKQNSIKTPKRTEIVQQ